MYNSNYISKIRQERTKVIATFQDGEEIVIGNFRLIKEAHDIFQSVTRALLTEDKDCPGIVIKDTRKEK
jgi:repressor of nif and glnA expression